MNIRINESVMNDYIKIMNSITMPMSTIKKYLEDDTKNIEGITWKQLETIKSMKENVMQIQKDTSLSKEKNK